MSSLAELGLAAGDRVRFRRGATGRWHQGRVTRREADGSIGLSDGKGASRAIPVDQCEVRTSGKRGASMWAPVAVRAARTEQLKLL